MEYQVKATSIAHRDATVHLKQSNLDFGITSKTSETLPNPAELLLSAFAACLLKNVERFSIIMNFSYESASLIVNSKRLEKPPRMDDIYYQLIIKSDDKRLNIDLLEKNLMNHGTIFNTLAIACSITGEIIKS